MSDAIRVVSLFCGIGGADLGLYLAADDLGVEVEVVDAIDSWEPAVRVYNANQRHPVARVADVKALQSIRDCDLVIGGPPCQPFSNAGKRTGHSDERNCIPDFLRLVGDRPYIMENVKPGLIPQSWSEKIRASDCGDVTSRQRWFYSNYLLHVHKSPGTRRWRHIRENGHEVGRRKYHGVVVPIDPDGFAPSFTARSWHGFDIRSGAKTLVRTEDGGLRCPTVLEMARCHSIPDAWDWASATKTDRGKMIANCWPVFMAKAVCMAMLRALIAEREMAA